jgi:hypothetical protein
MGAFERWKRSERARENAGKPLGGGLDATGALPGGAASIGELRVEKPIEQGGERGLSVRCVLRTEGLGACRLVAETTLHEQGRGPLKSARPQLADTQGMLEVFEVLPSRGDEPRAVELTAFVPFAAIEVERAGRLKCFARVRILEQERGLLAQAETAFEIEAG